MLPRSKRLPVPLFNKVLALGRVFHSPLFSARIMHVPGESRFSAAVSKKIAKTAVERNKLRRRIYSGVRLIEKKLTTGFHILLLAKPPLAKATLSSISHDLEGLFVKSGLIK